MTLPKKPLSRIEQYLNVLATGEGEAPLEAKSRIEKLLNAIITRNKESLESPASRIEQYLSVLASEEGELPIEPKSRVEKLLNAIIAGNEKGIDNPISRIEQYLYYILKNGGIEGGSPTPQEPLFLYNKGDECKDVTLGWVKYQQIGSGGTGMKISTYLNFGDETNSICSGGFVTGSSIDLTNYSRLHFTMQVNYCSIKSGTEGSYHVRIGENNTPNSLVSVYKCIVPSSSYSLSETEASVDISNYKGKYYISVSAEAQGSVGSKLTAKLHQMYLT